MKKSLLQERRDDWKPRQQWPLSSAASFSFVLASRRLFVGNSPVLLFGSESSWAKLISCSWSPPPRATASVVEQTAPTWSVSFLAGSCWPLAHQPWHRLDGAHRLSQFYSLSQPFAIRSSIVLIKSTFGRSYTSSVSRSCSGGPTTPATIGPTNSHWISFFSLPPCPRNW